MGRSGVPSLEEVADFAGSEVLSTLDSRYECGEFRRELWKAMGGAGLFGIGVDESLGGGGGSPADLAASLRRFAFSSCDMGLTLSWVTHLALCVKSIEMLGTPAQKEEYLPGLISGEWVGAAAVSEPRTGGHPGGIETIAARTSRGYRLDGEKLYITCGTVADLLVVVAATGRSGNRRELTAFLVPADSPGVNATRMDLEFLRTSPHARITFEGAEVPVSAVLGTVGDGHVRASKPAFARERSLVLAAFSGLFRRVAEDCAGRLAERDGRLEMEGARSASWIHHLSALSAYDQLTTFLVRTAFEDPERWRSSMDVMVYLGISYAAWASWMDGLARREKLAGCFPLGLMLSDMKLVAVGEKILYKEGRRRFIDGYAEGGGKGSGIEGENNR